MITSRSGSQGSSSAPPVQTIEVVRRRARHRLIGAAVLVLAGVLVFPLLFDTEPRPVAGEIPIEIPSRGEASSLQKPDSKEVSTAKPVSKPAASDATPAPASGALPASESLDAREQVVQPVGVQANTAAKGSPKPEAKSPEPKGAEVKKDSVKTDKDALAAAAKVKASDAEAARAKALLENKSPAGAERLVVQVGAFAEAASARATRMKLERAGLTTYTHVAETAAGKLIRVRVGPFATRAEAEKIAAKVKALGLPARILAL